MEGVGIPEEVTPHAVVAKITHALSHLHQKENETKQRLSKLERDNEAACLILQKNDV